MRDSFRCLANAVEIVQLAVDALRKLSASTDRDRAIAVLRHKEAAALLFAGDHDQVFDALFETVALFRDTGDVSRMVAAAVSPRPSRPHAAGSREPYSRNHSEDRSADALRTLVQVDDARTAATAVMRAGLYQLPVAFLWHPVAHRARIEALLGKVRMQKRRLSRQRRCFAANDGHTSERGRSIITRSLLAEAEVLAQHIGMPVLLGRIRRLRGASSGSDGTRLTAREIEVLVHASRGYSNEEIAVVLGISRNAVSRHLQNMFQKTGTANRTELAGYALKAGLIE